MERTVIAVWKAGDRAEIRFKLESPSLGASPLEDRRLVCSMRSAPLRHLADADLKPQAVRKAGEKLLRALLSHPNVRQALEAAMEAARQRATPLYFHVDHTEAEALPWEILYEDQASFLALSSRQPIARITGTRDGGTEIYRTFTRTCRILAVMSAAQVTAEPEWDALYGALAGVGFEPRLRVLVGEPDLHAKITALQAQDPRIEAVEFVPPDANRLIDQIKRFNPHILHFFCHGHAGDRPHLRIALNTDWITGMPDGSLSVESSEFLPLQTMASETWIMVLNCCKTSAGGPSEVRSLALSLINQGPHIPAVVGMREAVAAGDAHLFTGSFYGAIAARIDQFLGGAELAETDWVGVLDAPRKLLAKQYGGNRLVAEAAADAKQWTLPVMYIRPEPFVLRRGVDAAPETPASPVARLTPEQRLSLEAQLTAFRKAMRLAASEPALLAEIYVEVRAIELQLEAA